MEFTLSIEIYCIAVLLLAFVGEAVFGFGGGLVSVPLLSLVIDVRDAVVLASIFQCLLSFLIFLNYKDVMWEVIKPLIFGVVVGVVVGAYSLSFLDIEILRYILSAFIIIFLIKTLFFSKLFIKRSNAYVAVLSGLLSGFFQGCIGTGGPNLVIYLKNIIPNQRNFRASMICALSVASFSRMPFFAAAEFFTPAIWKIALPTFPLFAVGTLLGQRFHHIIPSRLYFGVVYFFLLISAVSLIWRNISG